MIIIHFIEYSKIFSTDFILLISMTSFVWGYEAGKEELHVLKERTGNKSQLSDLPKSKPEP